MSIEGLEVHVLRIGHRIIRDARLTTHVLLAARALGAKRSIYTGERDKGLEESIRRVVDTWGGTFDLIYKKSWRQAIEEWRREEKGEIIHLTVYGEPIQEAIPKIKASSKKKLIIVGGAKVPGALYEITDYNVSVSSQPHSEVAALAIFLHELFEGKELEREFEGAKMKIIPNKRGKTVIKLSETEAREKKIDGDYQPS